ncbi:MAG: 7-cyano-7-deazaguanine synthase [Phycisphaeraceae bacterium]|nr:MAG: 7-cyano-7-deazaguanine synthase [Phycisphaeraceae bacterium]
MCGIAGVLRIHEPGEPVPPHRESIPEAWLDILDDAIRHRGPDGAGRFRDRATRPGGVIVDVALVHRRLSIIDHAGGAQPMVHVRHADGLGELLRASPHPSGTGFQPVSSQSSSAPPTLDATTLPPDTDLVAVAFNGCIYNHHELRGELKMCRHRFETDHADTEVLVHAWREWGMYMQDELDGMYSMLIWDRRTGQLVTARDLAGEKPLYQANRAGARLICSCVPGCMDAPEAYPPGFEDWVRFGAEAIPAVPAYAVHPGEWCIWPPTPPRGAKVPAPRKRAMLTLARLEPQRVLHRIDLPLLGRRHHLPTRGEPRSIAFHPRSLEICTPLLHIAIMNRLEADTPLGLFLSGGLDSGLIAAIAKQHRPDIKAFTVRMPDPRMDESEAAAETAAHLGVDHTILDCDPCTGQSTPADDLVHLIEQLGLPFGDSSLLPTYWVCRAAREHVKVALSGDGGDELFGGYRRHTINPTLNRWRRLLRLIPDSLLDRRCPGSRSTYLARLAVAARHGGYSELLSIFPTPDLRRLLTFSDPDIEEPDQPGDDAFFAIDDPLRHDFQNYLPDDLLRKTDTASMAVALEVRAPFLARDLVDAAMRTPLDVLMPKGERKGLLKQIARRYLPDSIVDRPKQGFAIPIGEWFRTDFGGLRQLLYDHLESTEPFPGLANAGIEINMSFVRRMLTEHDAAGERSVNPWKGRDHSQRLYMLLVLSIWSRWLARIGREGDAASR